MKKMIVPLALCFLSCNGILKRDMKDFIPGSYVRPIRHDYATGADTLIITLIRDDTYQIVKRSGYRRILNGEVQSEEYHVVQWNAYYDRETEQLKDEPHGKTYSFDPRRKELHIGQLVYQKIK